MSSLDFIGFDVHKKTISFCVKAGDGQILEEGKIAARRGEPDRLDEGAQPSLDGSDGGDAIFRLDLRSLTTSGRGVESGAPSDAEGDHRIEKEERSSGCAQAGRLAAL